jgi:hypothetical protein
MVDQEELILCDRETHQPLSGQSSAQYSPQQQAPNSQVDQEERILSDVPHEFVDDKPNHDPEQLRSRSRLTPKTKDLPPGT